MGSPAPANGTLDSPWLSAYKPSSWGFQVPLGPGCWAARGLRAFTPLLSLSLSSGSRGDEILGPRAQQGGVPATILRIPSSVSHCNYSKQYRDYDGWNTGLRRLKTHNSGENYHMSRAIVCPFLPCLYLCWAAYVPRLRPQNRPSGVARFTSLQPITTKTAKHENKN